MSFRNRLTVFFIVLVILPMVVVAAVGFVLASDSEQGKADAGLGVARDVAFGLFGEYQGRAERAAATIGHDAGLAGAIRAGKRAAIQRRLEQLTRDARAERVVMTLERGGRFEAGRADGVAAARTRLIDDRGATAGMLV